MKLTIVIKRNKEDAFLMGQIKEIPHVVTQGESVEEVEENILDALELYLLDMREEYVLEESTIREKEICI